MDKALFGDLKKQMRRQAIKTICEDPKIKNLYIAFRPITDGAGEKLILVRVEDRSTGKIKEVPLIQDAFYSVAELSILAVDLITKGDNEKT